MAATLKDLARETGLGLATLSKYFNGGTVREKNRLLIEAAVKKLRYVPNEVARSLKTQQTRVIGVIIPELSNAFITSIISSMEDILRKHDYAVIVCDCRSNAKREKEAVEFLMHRRVDGLINMATDTTGAHLKMPLAAGIPVLLIDRLIESLRGKASAVIIDNVHAAGQAVRKLTDFGHRRIDALRRIYPLRRLHDGRRIPGSSGADPAGQPSHRPVRDQFRNDPGRYARPAA